MIFLPRTIGFTFGWDLSSLLEKKHNMRATRIIKVRPESCSLNRPDGPIQHCYWSHPPERNIRCMHRISKRLHTQRKIIQTHKLVSSSDPNLQKTKIARLQETTPESRNLKMCKLDTIQYKISFMRAYDCQ